MHSINMNSKQTIFESEKQIILKYQALILHTLISLKTDLS